MFYILRIVEFSVPIIKAGCTGGWSVCLFSLVLMEFVESLV